MKYILAVLSLLIAAFTYYAFKNNNIYPFKCITFSEYNLFLKKEDFVFNVSQDLRLYNERHGLFSISGKVEDANGNNSIIDRKLLLTKGVRVDSDTVEYMISNVEKGAVDDTNDDIYNVFLREFTTSKEILRLDLLHVSQNIWVIGTPASYVMTCHSY